MCFVLVRDRDRSLVTDAKIVPYETVAPQHRPLICTLKEITHMDRIRNDAIRQKFDVAPMADKMHEARLRWYGHVLRGKEDSVRKIGLNFEVKGKRPRGRPKQRWSDTLHMDLKVVVSTLI
ncbi:unnamed protein product [Heligmosomoides polygyrus]|uniref:Reverse transcriptase domain-containing protein n=1 Tax=Heligmosomoides polygyrus TaxID=6339 RepID=A0A183G9T4_HELPZ|nr:unnamed protein product [Heligmosomoides polygyrus]